MEHFQLNVLFNECVSAKPAVNKLIKNKAIGAASIHKNQTAKPPNIAPKLFPLPSNYNHNPN